MRLPVAYDLVQRRWMHLNGSFFHADGAPYTAHVTEWNSNCVFCHNVKAQPGFDWEKKSWNTEVAELGIACGACHGPTGEHGQRAISPLTRYRWHFNDSNAAPIAVVNPVKIDSDRAAMICGHCHGQRLPDRRPHSGSPKRGRSIRRGRGPAAILQTSGRDAGETSVRHAFWADGSPRLTAYSIRNATFKMFSREQTRTPHHMYLGHSMHGGDPRGQITQEKRTNAATVCQQFSEADGTCTAHEHGAQSAAVCYNCHMPQIVFGIMSAHRIMTHDSAAGRNSAVR